MPSDHTSHSVCLLLPLPLHVTLLIIPQIMLFMDTQAKPSLSVPFLISGQQQGIATKGYFLKGKDAVWNLMLHSVVPSIRYVKAFPPCGALEP